MMGPYFTAAFFAFLISIALAPFYIKISRKYQFGQQIRLDGPKRHLKKAGTPTMGGIIFLLSFLITIFWLAPRTPLLYLAVVMILFSAILGFIDDFQKVVRNHSLGLKARHKLLGQFVFAMGFYLFLVYLGHSTAVVVPFTGIQIELGAFYPILIFIMIIGTSNAVNLTDGIDGLAAGTAILAFLAFLFIASVQGYTEVAYLCGILLGACFGFLLFNMHPARVFMGDVGSLSLGTALAVIAVILKAELTLIIIGGVFVLETLSVIAQVLSFRLTKKRIFLMSPLHHHFELKGWSEWQVVTGFWALAFCFALLGLLEFSPLF